MFSKFDACLADNDINQTDPNLAKIFKNAHILKFNIEEMNADPRDKSEKFRMYNLTMISAKKPEKNISTAIDSAIAAIQQEFADENEIQENVNSISVAIADIDSLIAVAIKAGKGLGNRMEGRIKLLLRVIYTKGPMISFYKKRVIKNNCHFLLQKISFSKHLPILFQKKIETPIIIFAIGLIVWTLISILWIGASMIYNSEE